MSPASDEWGVRRREEVAVYALLAKHPHDKGPSAGGERASSAHAQYSRCAVQQGDACAHPACCWRSPGRREPPGRPWRAARPQQTCTGLQGAALGFEDMMV